jgi:DNA-binding MarR family transcriptional regulator
MNNAFDRSRSAGYMTNWAARLFARAMDRRLKPLGLSTGHLPVLFALADGRALSQKALAEAAAIEQPTMAATLLRMERDGLVTRSRDPEDGRASLVALTAAARARLPEVRMLVEAINEEATKGLDAAEQAAMLALLARVVDNLAGDAG